MTRIRTSRARTRTLFTALVTSGVAFLTGCNQGGNDDGDLRLTDGTLVLTSGSNSGMDALITGTIAGVSQGADCLSIDYEDGPRLIAIFPDSTVLSEDGSGIRMANSDRIIAPGESMSFSGGAAEPPEDLRVNCTVDDAEHVLIISGVAD